MKFLVIYNDDDGLTLRETIENVARIDFTSDNLWLHPKGAQGACDCFIIYTHQLISLTLLEYETK